MVYIVIATHDEEYVDIKDDRVKPVYEISNYGNIRNKQSGNYIRPWADKDGYHRVTLRGVNKQVKFYVHRLVAHFFISPFLYNYKLQVNHLNAIKTFNYYENLEWVTPQENIKHSWLTNLQNPVKGEDHGQCRYNEEMVHTICKLKLKGNDRNEVLQTMYELYDYDDRSSFRHFINHVYNGKSWRHISDQYSQT